MRSKFVVFCVLFALFFSFFAAVEDVHAAFMLKDANNKVCPVTGDPITEKKFNSGYDGKRYWFSSFDAVLTFDKNPEKYLSEKKSQVAKTPVKKTYSKPEKRRWYQR